jgi:hypothetical protein
MMCNEEGTVNMISPDGSSNGQTLQRNRLEIIRFATPEAQRHAIRTLVECGNLNFSSSSEDEWAVRTDVVRALRIAGVPFEWLTEDA